MYFVHFPRADRAGMALFIQILEKVLSWQLLTAPDNTRKAGIIQSDRMLLPALSAKREGDGGALNAGVAISEGCQPIGAVLLRILIIAHANERSIEQLHDSRQHFLARDARQTQVAPNSCPDTR